MDPFYAIVGVTLFACFLAVAFGLGVRRALWLCLLLLPLRIVLPESAGQLVGFENLVLVPDLLVPATFVVWLLRRLAGGGSEGGGPRGRLLPGAMVAVMVAFLLSYRPGSDARAFLSELEKWSVYILTFIVASQELRRPGDLTKTVNVLLAGGLLATARDLPDYFSVLSLPAPLGYEPNRDALLFSSFNLERYQGTGWPFTINALFLLILARLVVGDSTRSRGARWALRAYGGVLLWLLVLSFYRGAWLSLGATLLVGLAAPRLRRMARELVPMAAVAAALTVVVLGWQGGAVQTGVEQRGTSLVTPGSEPHVLMRLDGMAEGWQMFRDHPLTGIGLGQYGPNFEAYAGAQIFGLATDASYFQQANNDYVQYLATTGLIGFAAVGTLFVGFLVRGYRLARSPRFDPETQAVLYGSVLAIVVYLANAMSEDPTWDKSVTVLLFTLFGCIWAAGAHAARAASAEAAAPTLA